jgi:hypothetical protein
VFWRIRGEKRDKMRTFFLQRMLRSALDVKRSALGAFTIHPASTSKPEDKSTKEPLHRYHTTPTASFIRAPFDDKNR